MKELESLNYTEAEMREVCRQAREYNKHDLLTRANKVLENSANRRTLNCSELQAFLPPIAK